MLSPTISNYVPSLPRVPRFRVDFKGLDYSLLLAAAVEVPRWTVAFMAINEHPVFGVPLGALLAYSMKAGWEHYFEDRRRFLSLFLNILSLAAAVVVITPVLHSMVMEAGILSKVLSPIELKIWSYIMACTTFLPLIVIAATRTDRVEEEGEQDVILPSLVDQVLNFIGIRPRTLDEIAEFAGMTKAELKETMIIQTNVQSGRLVKVKPGVYRLAK